LSISLEEMTSIWKAFSILSNVQEVLATSETIDDVGEAIDLINTAKLNLHEVLARDLNLLADTMMHYMRQGVK